MLTVTSPEAKAADLAALRADCKALRVTHDRIAKEAGVSRPLVVNVFAGRSTSGNVIKTAERLVARAKRRRTKAQNGSAA